MTDTTMQPTSKRLPLLVRSITLVICLCLFVALPIKAANRESQTRYLLFQIFTYGGKSDMFPQSADVEATVKDIKTRIQTTGNRKNKLGVCLGPLILGQQDDDIRNLIRLGFQLAKKYDVAIAFHIDDQMFYDDRKDLSTRDTIEWTNWNGTLCTGRRLDWGLQPGKAAPPLCLNSRTVQRAVSERAYFIGQELKKNVDELKAEGKDYLYAGTIAGWESMIGSDYATNKHTGYHALANRGYSAAHQPANADRELFQVVKDFIELWSQKLIEGGAPREKLYCHIALGSQGIPKPGNNIEEAMGYTTAETAFDKWYHPGFSLYPEENTLNQVHAVVKRHNSTNWIMAEGANVVPSGVSGEPTMESYLAKLFNYGAVAANIFSWGIGGEAERERNLFRRVTENNEAIDAYRKFLAGQSLTEARPSVRPEVLLREKIEKINKQLPNWIYGKPARVQEAQSLMTRLERAMKSNNFQQVDATADEILRRLNSSD